MYKIIQNSLLFIIFLITINLASASTLEKKNVLYINSYNIGFFWADDILKGVQEGFANEKNVALWIEHLDSKHFSDSTYFDLLKEMFAYKYSKKKFDLIVLSDNNALTFYLNNRLEFFGEIPAVFCGVENIEEYDLASKPIYGVQENSNYYDVLDLYAQLHPNANNLFIFIGKSKSKQVSKSIFLSYKERFKEGPRNINLQIIDDFELDSLSAISKRIQAPDIIFYGGIQVDKYGKSIDYEDAFIQIQKSANVPVYGGVSQNTLDHILGGVMSEGYIQGEEASRIAIRLLNNETDIPKITVPKYRYLFDYSKVKKLKLNPKLIPQNTEYINTPFNVLKEYRSEILITLSSFVLLLLIVSFQAKYIRQRGKYEKKLVVAIKKAEESDRLKSAFLSNMSHEIRTPLNSILGFSGLILNQTPKDQTIKMYHQHMQHSSEKLMCLIDDIMCISRLELHEIQLKYTEKDLSDFLQQIIEQVKSYQKRFFQKNTSKIQLEIPLSPFLFTCDYSRLDQVLTNLLHNALKFTSNGEIKCGFELINNDTLRFYVCDNGIGIKKDYQKVIFDRFRKLEEENQTTYEGSGLGLSICKQLVELMGGEIGLTSVFNKGSEFYFTLPIR